MSKLKFLILGILFGIVLTKSEVISWYRIYEMFRFESFHMYGVIGSAVVLGIIFIQIIKKLRIKGSNGEQIQIEDKPRLFWPPLLGGTIFGLGWALTGACPGPIYVIIGTGFGTFVVVLLSALLGTLVYGLVRNKLPQK